MLPDISPFTGLNAAPPSMSKRRVRASEASRNSAVEMALSLLSSTGTSAKDFLPSKKVPPGGKAMVGGGDVLVDVEWRERTGCV